MPVTPDLVGNKSDAVVYVSGAEAPIAHVTALDDVKLAHPMETKVLLPGPKGSLLEYHLPKGTLIPPHRFAHDFINCLVRGRLKVSLAGQSYEAEARDSWTGAPGVQITMETLEDCVLLEWMSPPHLLSGSRLITWGAAPASDSHIFVKWSQVEEYKMTRVEGETEFGPPGVDIQHRLKVLVPGPYGSVIWNSHRKGKWALHTHGHHWVCYLVQGKMKEKFGGSLEYIAQAGDIWAAQAGAAHCTEALDDNELYEFKWPAPMYWRGIIHSWDPR